MATRKPKSTAVVKWDEELAKYAEAAATAEAKTGGGQFFGTKGGILTWADAPVPNNEMAVVVIDTVFENVYYEGEYDPDTPQAPTCFAFSHDEDMLSPHKVVVEAGQKQNDKCEGCEHNEFGTANRGRGKACRNTRRLAMIPAGQFDRSGAFDMFEDVSHYETAAVGYMKLPVTSVKGYANFVKQVAAGLKRPPFGIVTKVKVLPDPKNQFKVTFEPVEKLPDELIGAIMQRREEVVPTIDFPYSLEVEDTKPAKKPASRRTRKY